jgi:hypothetical protein
VPLAREPLEPLRKQREHIDPHSPKLAANPVGADAGAQEKARAVGEGKLFERERSNRRELC